MNRAADAILAAQIPSSSSPFATSAQTFPPKDLFSFSQKNGSSSSDFFLIFHSPFPDGRIEVMHATQLTSFRVENWSCHIPPRIGISPNSGVPSTPRPRCHLGFRSSTPFSYTNCVLGWGGRGTGGGGISREFPSGEHLKSDRAGAASIHPSIAVGRTTEPVGAGGRGR